MDPSAFLPSQTPHQKYANVIRRILTYKESQRRSFPFIQHTCARDVCHPENEAAFIPHGNQCVFVCDYHVVHVCTSSECNLYQTQTSGTCPISGVHYQHPLSSYDKRDQRTYYIPQHVHLHNKRTRGDRERQQQLMVNMSYTSSTGVTTQLSYTKTTPPSLPQIHTDEHDNDKRKRRKKPPTRKPPPEFNRKEAHDLIEKLLYSNIRKLINRKETAEITRKMKKELTAYGNRQQEQRQLKRYMDIMQIADVYGRKMLSFQDLPYDSGRIAYYAAIGEQVWDKVLRFIEMFQIHIDCKRDPQSVLLATLYSMRQGYVVDGMSLIPYDPFIAQHIPPINHFDAFDISKHLVTQGQKLINTAYTHAVDGRDRLRSVDLLLDMTVLPSFTNDMIFFKPVSRKKDKLPHKTVK